MTDFENRTDARNQRLSFILLTVTVFFGASLLFSMEPLVGRLLTPYFGGAVHVWLTCLMFFQATLLLGYLYAKGGRNACVACEPEQLDQAGRQYQLTHQRGNRFQPAWNSLAAPVGRWTVMSPNPPSSCII